MKLTRRQLVIAATAVTTGGVKAMAQSGVAAPPVSAPATPTPGANTVTSALDNVRQNRDTLAKFAIPMDVEPAFQFKA